MKYNQEDLIVIEPINNEGLNLPFIALVERCYYDEGEYNVEATILDSKIEMGYIVANMQQVKEAYLDTCKYGQIKEGLYLNKFNFLVFSFKNIKDQIGTLNISGYNNGQYYFNKMQTKMPKVIKDFKVKVRA